MDETTKGQGPTEEPEKEPGLTAEQEAGLAALNPDFKPRDEDDKPKRKSKSQVESEQMIGMVYAGLFGVLAGRLGDHWALSADEVGMLTEPTVAVCEKYFPDMKLGPEVALLSAVAMVVMPRVLLNLSAPIEGESTREAEPDGNQSEHAA